MRTIWKFSTLTEGDFRERFTLQMPIGAEILTIQTDQKNNHPTIWALVDPESEVEDRHFELYGTGHSIEDDAGVERKYIGTYQYQKGEFVGHIFEIIK
jgi:hypothetical protein